MEEYVYIDGKKYIRGYTTGSCATAASKAATYMLLTKKKIKTIIMIWLRKAKKLKINH